TTFHLIGSDDAKRGPSQYVHFSSSIAREPSRMSSAPRTGLAPTPIGLSAATAETAATRKGRANHTEESLKCMCVCGSFPVFSPPSQHPKTPSEVRGAC